MEKENKHRFGRQQIIPLLLYFLLLWGIYAGYNFGARYELFMQSIDTLWPVIGFTLLLVIVICNALLLARGVRLWLLCVLHGIGMALLVANAMRALYKHSHEHLDGHICFPPWMLIPIPLILSTLPPLLGHALLQVRRLRAQKAQSTGAAEELSFLSAADILGEDNTLDATKPDDSSDTRKG